jgi:hypothetical protein
MRYPNIADFGPPPPGHRLEDRGPPPPTPELVRLTSGVGQAIRRGLDEDRGPLAIDATHLVEAVGKASPLAFWSRETIRSAVLASIPPPLAPTTPPFEPPASRSTDAARVEAWLDQTVPRVMARRHEARADELARRGWGGSAVMGRDPDPPPGAVPETTPPPGPTPGPIPEPAWRLGG